MREREPLSFTGTWVAVGLGVFVGSSWVSPGAVLDMLNDSDSDPNTYDKSELKVVEFSPQPGLDCRGLSPSGTEEILASTIVCEPVIVED